MAKWQCSVCGYAHEGSEAPSQCPVCGTDRARFSLVGASEDTTKDRASDILETSQDPDQRWQCAVCGYIHTGPEPPDQCPVCGVDASQFKALEALASPEAPAVRDDSLDGAVDQRWQCVICGYIHTGPKPPNVCPVCGADATKFVLLEEPEEATEASTPPEDEPTQEETAASEPGSESGKFLDRYRSWIDLAIEYHAHPIAVHIPNGVLPIAVAMVFLAALFDWPMIGQAAVYNMGFIFISMPAVLFTGYLHWQYKFGGNMTDLFKWKVICGAIVFGLSFILFSWGLLSPSTARDPGFFYLLLHVVMLAVAGVAGWLGGKLVFHPNQSS